MNAKVKSDTSGKRERTEIMPLPDSGRSYNIKRRKVYELLKFRGCCKYNHNNYSTLKKGNLFASWQDNQIKR